MISVGRLIDQKVTAIGRGLSLLFYYAVLLPLVPPVGWPVIKQIYFYVFDRAFSLAHTLGIVTYNVIRIESIVDQEVVDYIKAFKEAEDLSEDASSEEKNEKANRVVETALKLLSNRRPDGLLKRP